MSSSRTSDRSSEGDACTTEQATGSDVPGHHLPGAERGLDRIRVLVESRRTTHLHSSALGCFASALQRQVMIGQVPCGEQSADQDEVRTEQQLQLHPGGSVWDFLFPEEPRRSNRSEHHSSLAAVGLTDGSPHTGGIDVQLGWVEDARCPPHASGADEEAARLSTRAEQSLGPSSSEEVKRRRIGEHATGPTHSGSGVTEVGGRTKRKQEQRAECGSSDDDKPADASDLAVRNQQQQERTYHALRKIGRA